LSVVNDEMSADRAVVDRRKLQNCNVDRTYAKYIIHRKKRGAAEPTQPLVR
jgi:hypothetical protein